MAETLVPEGQVHELLGVKVAPRSVGHNLTVLRALGQRWINREDLLKYLRASAAASDSEVLARLTAEIAEVTAGGN